MHTDLNGLKQINTEYFLKKICQICQICEKKLAPADQADQADKNIITMILEAAFLYVKSDLAHQFETDFAKASQYISSIDGYLGHRLEKCLEVENKYLLLVDWNTLEDHTEGFRNSEAYLEWKKILHHYYEPFPVVEHFETVFENKK